MFAMRDRFSAEISGLSVLGAGLLGAGRAILVPDAAAATVPG